MFLKKLFFFSFIFTLHFKNLFSSEFSFVPGNISASYEDFKKKIKNYLFKENPDYEKNLRKDLTVQTDVLKTDKYSKTGSPNDNTDLVQKPIESNLSNQFGISTEIKDSKASTEIKNNPISENSNPKELASKIENKIDQPKVNLSENDSLKINQPSETEIVSSNKSTNLLEKPIEGNSSSNQSDKLPEIKEPTGFAEVKNNLPGENSNKTVPIKITENKADGASEKVNESISDGSKNNFNKEKLLKLVPVMGGVAAAWSLRNSDFNYFDFLPDKFGKSKAVKIENSLGLKKIFDFALGKAASSFLMNKIINLDKLKKIEIGGKALIGTVLGAFLYNNGKFFKNSISNIYTRSNSYYWKAEKLINIYFESIANDSKIFYEIIAFKAEEIKITYDLNTYFDDIIQLLQINNLFENIKNNISSYKRNIFKKKSLKENKIFLEEIIKVRLLPLLPLLHLIPLFNGDFIKDLDLINTKHNNLLIKELKYILVDIAKIENLEKQQDINKYLEDLINFYEGIKKNFPTIKFNLGKPKNFSDFENLINEQIKKLNDINSKTKNKDRNEILEYLGKIQDNKNLVFNANSLKLAGLTVASGIASHFTVKNLKSIFQD